MAYESKGWAWSPTEATNHNYVSNLATMASSIENKVGRYVYSAEGVATILDSTNFAPYSPGNVLKVIREGKFATLVGTWSVKTAGYIEPVNSRIFAQLPAGFRPKERVVSMMQGSSSTYYTMIIGTDGKISASRCSGNQSAGYWMPIQLVWLAED